MSILIDILIFALGFFVLIAVHEWGHFAAGWAGGIPARNMRVRLFTFPQHVVLRNGDHWVSPFEFEAYLATMWAYLKTTPKVYLYTVGGLLAETLFSVGAFVMFVECGRPKWAFLIAFMSCCLFAGAVLMLDVVLAMLRGHACGDISGMWAMAKVPTALIFMALAAVRVWMLWYLLT
jgi:hypothetical protein